MKQKLYIQGFHERLHQACLDTGLPKTEIARRCNFDRRILNPAPYTMMTPVYIARFCAVTGTDANWLLGVKR
jgi:hypothetical protein